jgi:hypothetical protein
MLVWDCRYAVCAYPGLMLTQLRAFLVALEEGSLNRAAIRLRMSQHRAEHALLRLRDDPRALRASTYHPPLDITGLIPRSYNTRQSAASILVQLKAVDRFHRSEAGCNRGILIQTAKTI